MNEYKVVMLCTADTVRNIEKYLSIWKELLKPKAVVIIGSKAVGKWLEEERVEVEFKNEDELYPGMTFQHVKDRIRYRTDNPAAVERTGWYFQQFLKMAYSMQCKEESYLVWDADTVPTHSVEMTDKTGRYYFDIKTEYNKAYFDTLSRLFPQLKKKNTYSYIAEHMLFHAEIMRELISAIEGNDAVEGKDFWEKILHAVAVKDIPNSGFSEFETYGTYVEYYHADAYRTRKWKSLREGTVFFGTGITRGQMEYLRKEYDAVSFEQHAMHQKMARLLSRKPFQRLWFIRLFEGIKSKAGWLKGKI
ncbi:MAG: hypothetical protein GX234_06140 [Clostridiales bacterium]|mgnify:CR=1 FL=1|nr:hypothetical protein [Clostridiales bacterium]